MGDWNEELPTVKAKKRGVIDQKPHRPKSPVKKPAHFHVDYYAPRWVHGRWRTWSKCHTEQEARAVVSKMSRSLPGWNWRMRDNRVELPNGKFS